MRIVRYMLIAGAVWGLAVVSVQAGAVGEFAGRILLDDGRVLDGSGPFDLNPHDLIVAAGAENREAVLAWVVARVREARQNRNTIGLFSTLSGNDPLKGLAVIMNDDGAGRAIFNVFAGKPVDVNCILVKWTWLGDTTLDGRVNADDYFRIDSGFLGGLKGFRNGDLNYDNKINGDDYFLIDSAFLAQSGTLSAGMALVGVVAGPQPPDAPHLPLPPAAWGGLLLLGSICLVRPRRSAV